MGIGMDPVSGGLANGLRALEVLAAHAPLDLGAFAALNGLTTGDAMALLGTFEQTGYVERITERSLFVLTPMAIALVPPSNTAARLN